MKSQYLNNKCHDHKVKAFMAKSIDLSNNLFIFANYQTNSN